LPTSDSYVLEKIGPKSIIQNRKSRSAGSNYSLGWESMPSDISAKPILDLLKRSELISKAKN
jgi:hypothetical protein